MKIIDALEMQWTICIIRDCTIDKLLLSQQEKIADQTEEGKGEMMDRIPDPKEKLPNQLISVIIAMAEVTGKSFYLTFNLLLF